MLTITDAGTMLTSYLNVKLMLTLLIVVNVNVNVTVAIKDLVGSIPANYIYYKYVGKFVVFRFSLSFKQDSN